MFCSEGIVHMCACYALLSRIIYADEGHNTNRSLHQFVHVTVAPNHGEPPESVRYCACLTT